MEKLVKATLESPGFYYLLNHGGNKWKLSHQIAPAQVNIDLVPCCPKEGKHIIFMFSKEEDLISNVKLNILLKTSLTSSPRIFCWNIQSWNISRGEYVNILVDNTLLQTLLLFAILSKIFLELWNVEKDPMLLAEFSHHAWLAITLAHIANQIISKVTGF